MTARILESGGHDQIGLTNSLMWISTPSRRISGQYNPTKLTNAGHNVQRRGVPSYYSHGHGLLAMPITFTFLIITNEIPVCSSILAYQAYRWSSPLSYFIKFMWWAKGNYEALPRLGTGRLYSLERTRDHLPRFGILLVAVIRALRAYNLTGYLRVGL